MCTLTILKTIDGCVVTMNRDELRTRRESGMVHATKLGNSRHLYPIDVSSGGTWFGVSNRGIILGILNRYQAPIQHQGRSRGEIIPTVLKQGGYAQVYRWLETLDCAPFNPFDLFLICRGHARHFSWDSQSYTIKAVKFNNGYMFSSSSVHTTAVIAYRKKLFRSWWESTGSELNLAKRILYDYHLVQARDRLSHSVLMNRGNTHTKSVIQVKYNGCQMTLKYIPEIQHKALDLSLAAALVKKVEVIEH